MKKIQLILIAGIACLAIFSSCERCVTCTYAGEQLDNDTVTDICSKNGNILDDQIRVLESTNWNCEE